MASDSEKIIDVWKVIIKKASSNSWVVFENGTCVVLEGSVKEKDSAVEKATEVISSFGPVVAGTPAGDFNVTKVRHNDGWIVTCAHPDVMNFVSPAEIDGGAEDGMSVGLLGRSKRDADGRNPKVIHVEIP